MKSSESTYHCRLKSSSMGKGGQGRGRRGKRERELGRGYIQRNREIVEAARDPCSFLALLHRFFARRESLNVINISTILHRRAKMRVEDAIPAHILVFLAEGLRTGGGRGNREGSNTPSTSHGRRGYRPKMPFPNVLHRMRFFAVLQVVHC